jgi:hypothetical protein
LQVAYWGVSGGALVPVHGKGLYRDLEAGFLVGSTIGFNIGRYLALEMSTFGSGHPGRSDKDDDFPIAIFVGQVDLRWNILPAGSTVLPYLQLGLGLAVLTDSRVGVFSQEDVTRTTAGGNFRVGAGLDLNVRRHGIVGFRVTLNNILLAAPDDIPNEHCGDTYLLAVGAELFLALRF